MRNAPLGLLVWLACALAGCGLLVGTGVVVKSPKERDLAPATPRAVLQQVVADNSAFALDLYGKLRTNKGNLFFSPYSISTALAMTYAGARGETEKQMAKTLHFATPQQSLHPAFNSLNLELAKRGKDASGETVKDYRLDIANALWAQTGKRFQPALLEVLAQNYGAGMRLVDFAGNPEAARASINKWASEQTQGKIRDLVPAGQIDKSVALALTNAVYFKDKWAAPFKKEDTKPGVFNLLDGGKVKTDMMHQTAYCGYASGTDYQAVEISYRRGLSMVVLLPRPGQFAAFEKSLDTKKVTACIQDLHKETVDLALPGFKCESRFSLNDTLSAMGMPLAFKGGEADFTGIDGINGLLFISAVLHKAFVSVNEEGTEAAAATAVVAQKLAVPEMATIKFIADRPFIFLIRDGETGTILFVGRVLNPSAS